MFHQNQMLAGSPHGSNMMSRTVHHPDSTATRQNYGTGSEINQSSNRAGSLLQPISENKHAASNSFYDNQQFGGMYPQPGGGPKSTKRGKKDGGQSNMSMVLVMSNLMTKRKTGKRRGGQSQKPQSEATANKKNYH